MKKKFKYKVISEFKCGEKDMITVQIGSVVHVMSCGEWRKIYGRNHLSRWDRKIVWNDFNKKTKQYNVIKVS